jgi:hypothetical protein
MDVVKIIKLKVKPKQFFDQKGMDIQEKIEKGDIISDDEVFHVEQQSSLVLDGFGVDSIDDDIEMSLTLEDFLFDLYQLIPEPSAPLRKAAHQKFILGIAERLSSTVKLPDVIPVLSDDELDKVKHFIDNDDEFNKLQVKFQFNKKNDGSSGSLPLNPRLLGLSPKFIQTLAVLFKQS